MSKTVNTKILLRNDLAANWTTQNPTLGKGEIGVEVDTKKFKFGDGTTPWNTLPYGSGADIGKASASADGLMSKEDFSKLSGIAAGAQANVIEVVKRNGVALTVTNKAVDVTVPTKTSDITNDSGFITIEDVPEGAAASTTVPLMDGTAATGTEKAFARGDHRHPVDTSRAAASDLTTLAGRVTTIETTSLPAKADAATTLAGYGITDAYTKTQVDNLVSAVFTFKGTKATVSALPSSGNTVGDVWHVTADGSEYVWTDQNTWEELGVTVSLDGYATEAYVQGYAATAAQGTLADSALQSATIAGLTINKSSNTITKAQLQQALDVDDLDYSKVTSSNTNGNIKVDGTEMTVYTLPNTVLHSTDTLILDCGNSATNYTAS